MTNKRKLHHLWVRTKKVSYWYFMIGCLVCIVVSVFALRQNNLNVIVLRDNLLEIDEQNGDVETALNNLRQYVYSHMNTDLATSTSVYPPIQLKHRYDRLVEAENAKTAQDYKNTAKNDANRYCEVSFPQNTQSSQRQACIQNYLDTQPARVIGENQIPDSLYKFNFASPVWSPDLAGWSIVFAGIFFMMFLVSFLFEKWLRFEFRANN